MDIEAKKVQVQEDIARQPANVVFARIDIVNEIQLADLMKAEFIPYFRGTARSVSSGTSGNSTDTLHAVCVNLAKQRALLQGAAASDVIFFNIHSSSNNSNVFNNIYRTQLVNSFVRSARGTLFDRDVDVSSGWSYHMITSTQSPTSLSLLTLICLNFF